MTRLRLLLPLFALIFAGCAKLSAPVTGDYRATVSINGGDIPFQLRIATDSDKTQLWLLQDGEALPASQLHIKDHTLYATLPLGAGQLTTTISSDSLKGELQLTDAQGKAHQLPLTAQLNQTFRFVEQSSTDNIDVSGYWQLSAISPEHFNAPVTLQLKQSFDAVDGKLILNQPNESLHVYGQTHGDDVYFGCIGAGRAVLFKGHINAQGNLEGQLWVNNSDAIAAVATPIKEAEAEHPESLRQVALPWAVPTR